MIEARDEHQRGRRSRRRSAFSLIEVMVCVGLLAVGLLATMAVSLSSSHLQQTSRGTKKATMLMNDLLERYRAVGRAALPARLLLPFPNDRIGNYTVVTAPPHTEASFTIAGTVGGEPTELRSRATARASPSSTAMTRTGTSTPTG